MCIFSILLCRDLKPENLLIDEKGYLKVMRKNKVCKIILSSIYRNCMSAWLNINVQWDRMLVLHISKRNYAIVVYLEPGLQSVRALGSHHCGLNFLDLYSDPRCFSQILQFCPLTKINSSFDVILPALGWIVVRSTNWALKLGLKGHCHAFEWNSSRVKTLKIIKNKN